MSLSVKFEGRKFAPNDRPMIDRGHEFNYFWWKFTKSVNVNVECSQKTVVSMFNCTGRNFVAANVWPSSLSSSKSVDKIRVSSGTSATVRANADYSELVPLASSSATIPVLVGRSRLLLILKLIRVGN